MTLTTTNQTQTSASPSSAAVGIGKDIRSELDPQRESSSKANKDAKGPTFVFTRRDLERIVYDQFQFEPDYIRGQPGRGCSRLRLFGEDELPEVILFRDHHAWCPFCQKAWILLEELQISYLVIKVTMYNYGEKEWWYSKYIHQDGTFPSLIILKSQSARKLALQDSLERAEEVRQRRESVRAKAVDVEEKNSSDDKNSSSIPVRGDDGNINKSGRKSSRTSSSTSGGSFSTAAFSPNQRVSKSKSELDFQHDPGDPRRGNQPISKADYELVNDSTPVMARLVKLSLEKERTLEVLLEHDLSQPSWDLNDKRTAAICFNLVEGKLLAHFYRWLSCQRCNWTDENAQAIEKDNARLFREVCGEVEKLIGQTPESPFLLSYFSVSDCVMAPWLERMNAQLFYYKAFDMRAEFPVIAKWFQAMESRPSYMMSKADFFTHTHAIPHRIRPCYFDEWNVSPEKLAACWQAVEAGAEEVPDYFDRGARRSPRTSTEQVEAALEAAHRVLIFWDVLREKTTEIEGITTPVSKVSKKNSSLGVNANYTGDSFDLAMRLVLTRLLKPLLGSSTAQEAERLGSSLGDALDESQKAENPQDVLRVLQYYKDRISIPRDMSYHAGKRLRRVMFSVIRDLATDAGMSVESPFPIPYKNRFDVRPDKFVGKEHYKHVPKVIKRILEAPQMP
ncbi:unnamed protein product [Amoebophrya sp. A25]|nr:unnamed protein product [Amoebophrya sp. A25]|eukprot:GSA25T00008969001.1